MKAKLLFLILFLFTILSQQALAYNYVQFQAKQVNNYEYWSTLEFNEFETKVVVDGLFYETTLTMRVRLGKEYRWNYPNYVLTAPPSGDYEFIWNFNLPEKAVITDCKMWDDDKNAFIPAGMIDLSTAEENYDPSNTSKQQLLMREYRRREYDGRLDNFLELKIAPVDSREYKKIQIKYLTPCEMYWDVRRFTIDTRNFYRPYDSWYENNTFPNNDNPAVFKIIDKNNPDEKPRNIFGLDANWQKSGEYWQWEIGPKIVYNQWNDNVLLRVPLETVNGKYLKTFNDGDNKFYQCSLLPNIDYADRPSRHVIIAIDIKNGDSKSILDYLQYSIKYGLTSKDSVLFIVSDFNPTWLGDNFEPMTTSLIDQKINEAKTYDPKLNTLPFILRAAVNKLNQIDKGGEIWLISDDETHSETAAEAMQIVDQTIKVAKHNIKFRIMDTGYGSRIQINNKYYTGNEYLYENLFRLSGGSYKRLMDYQSYDWADVGFDVFAPTVGVVEIDPIPQGGFSYSRIDLNNGRKSFNMMSRYYQIGMYDGDNPFDILYNGYYEEELYRKTFTVEETDIKNEGDEFVKTYWFSHYIRENLLEQPQTYETIKYIEQLAVENNILTPYSGFLIPGPGNYIGFEALTLDDTLSISDSITTVLTEKPEVPKTYSLSAYPNPFNPTTTINIEMSNNADKNFTVEIYNILGQIVRTYEYNNNYSNIKTIVWNGKNEFGEDVSSGTYIVRYVSKQHVQTMKLLLIR